MRGIRKALFLLLVVATVMGLALLAAVLLPGYPNLAFMLALFVSMSIVLKVQLVLERRAMQRRIAPVLEVLKRAGPMASKEKDYQRVLFEQFFTDLTPGLKPESPLSSGTRVDACWTSMGMIGTSRSSEG
jgi:hypothetical protein